MKIDPVRKARMAQPFQPFAMVLVDGRSVSVAQPEFLAISPSGRVLAVYQPDDSFEVVELRQVKALRIGDVQM